MIKECTKKNISNILHVINDASLKYKGIIPNDCWNEHINNSCNRHEKHSLLLACLVLPLVDGVISCTDLLLTPKRYRELRCRKVKFDKA